MKALHCKECGHKLTAWGTEIVDDIEYEIFRCTNKKCSNFGKVERKSKWR